MQVLRLMFGTAQLGTAGAFRRVTSTVGGGTARVALDAGPEAGFTSACHALPAVH
jgi:hypothetical protein